MAKLTRGKLKFIRLYQKIDSCAQTEITEHMFDHAEERINMNLGEIIDTIRVTIRRSIRNSFTTTE